MEGCAETGFATLCRETEEQTMGWIDFNSPARVPPLSHLGAPISTPATTKNLLSQSKGICFAFAKWRPPALSKKHPQELPLPLGYPNGPCPRQAHAFLSALVRRDRLPV